MIFSICTGIHVSDQHFYSVVVFGVMAEDAKVARIEALYNLCSDIETMSGNLCDTLSFLSQAVWSEHSRLDSMLSLIQDKVNACEDALEYARSEYEYYCSNTPAEEYSSSYASQLQTAVYEAEICLHEARKDYSDGAALVMQGKDILSRINAFSSAAVSSVSSRSSEVVASVEKAAFHLQGYKG